MGPAHSTISRARFRGRGFAGRLCRHLSRTTINDAPAPLPSLTATERARADQAFGLLCGIGAYGTWGIVPIYFKLLAHVPAVVILGHRIAWSALFLIVIISAQRRWRELRACLANRHTLGLLAVSTLAITINWFTYIWAVTHDRVIAASLGYFINPLISVLLGVIFLKERLRIGQGAALVIGFVWLMGQQSMKSGVGLCDAQIGMDQYNTIKTMI